MSKTPLDSEDIFRKLAAAHGLELADTPLKLNNSGLDFAVAFGPDRTGTSWVMRQPRRPDVVASAAHEGRVLKALRPHLSVALPDWRIHSAELIAYPLLPGQPAGTIDLELMDYVWVIDHADPSENFVQSLAASLAQLHSLPASVLTPIGLDAPSVATLRSSLGQQMEVARSLLQIPAGVWERWQRWLADDASWPAQSAPTHGDCHAGHWLLDPTERLCGLLDWTEAGLADPSADLTMFYGTFGEAAFERLLAHYQAAGGPVWPRLKEHVALRWSAVPVGFASFAHSSGQMDYLPVAQNMLDAQV
ncbi:MAG: macrolide 2'-phosphotransferase [Candidatus Sericytochromatia bacterium]